MTIPDAGYTWSNTTAYAFTDANFNNGSVANQYLKMGRARSVRDLLSIERKGRGVPFFNTIAADSTGRALYADVGRYSNAPKSLIDSCTPAGLPQLVFDAARVITLDGSRSACTPNGYLPASAMPSLIRRDYVENSNDSFWLANPSSPITGITPLIGLDNTIQGMLTRWGNLVVRSVLGSGRRFGIGSLQAMWESDTSYLAQLVSKQLAALCRANPTVALSGGGSVDISEACPILDAYDDTGNLDSRGAWLFAAYQRRSPAGSDLVRSVQPRHPLDTRPAQHRQPTASAGSRPGGAGASAARRPPRQRHARRAGRVEGRKTDLDKRLRQLLPEHQLVERGPVLQRLLWGG